MGFLWFGTKDGLNRFDGYSFKTFRKATDKPGSLGNNNIRSLYQDKSGTLWVGTEKGLYQYNELTEEFKLAASTVNRIIDKITGDNSGHLWFISGFELCKYNKRNEKIQFYSSQHYFLATALCSSPDGTIWATATDGELKQYIPQADSFSGFSLFTHTTRGSTWLESLHYVPDGRYLVAGTSDTEIKIIDPEKAVYTDITLPQPGQKNLYIRSILQTTQDEFWLGAESGVFVFNLKTKISRHLKKDYGDPYSIDDNAVYTATLDRQGGVWLGTYFGGVNYLPNQQTPFSAYYPKKGENSLSGNVVREIKKDKYGNLWIGTEDAGLNKLDPNGVITVFKPTDKPGSISFFNIHGLLAVDNELWIGTFQHGLDVMDIRTGKVIRHYSTGTNSGLTHDFIHCIHQTPTGRIILGTPHGAFSYNQEKDVFTEQEGFAPGWYTAILQDRKGGLWGGTFGNGLQYYNAATGKRATFRQNEKDSTSISSDNIHSIFEDSRQNVWFATEGGLCRWNEKTQNFTRFGTANGFPSAFILSLLEDEEQTLWVSTTGGLVRFYPLTGKAEVFTASNGLIGNQFNYSSAFRDTSGRMYFGTTKGLVSFQPKAFRQNNQVVPVYLTGLQVNGHEVAIDSNTSPLQKSILHTSKITLTHAQSTFSIDFAALNYAAPDAMNYYYRMEGLSNTWINLKKARRVDFIGLAPGSYTFCVKASADGHVWSKEAKLRIVILPPWWMSPWAYAGYLLFSILLVAVIVWYYHQRMKEKNRRKMELLTMANEKELLELELAKEKELLQAKVEFFTNVAHEIKTPLTLIKVPLKKIIKKAGNNPDIENSLKIMDRNTSRLIELTGQLLDFRQTEINKFRLSLEQAEVTRLVADACASFTTLAEQNNLSFSVHLPETPVFAFIDLDAFNKIIYNLFSNAVKYADSKVAVHFFPCFKDNLSFTIKVKNDGRLIPDELKEKVFEPFFRIRATEDQSGTGIGLALARSLTHLHGGVLLLEPAEDDMNLFSLTLPTQYEPEKANHSNQTNKQVIT